MKKSIFPLQSLADLKYIGVECGEIQGCLHSERFFCPGTCWECIQLDNGEFVTPKKFALMGKQDILTHWKDAVSIIGVPIRYVHFCVA